MTDAVPSLRPRRVLLMGMMGTGKTTIGVELAKETGWRFLDNDALVERRMGRTARELQAEGLDRLRDAEGQALIDGLAEQPPVILGAAAGVVERADLREAMRAHATVVWLRASPEALTRRALPDLDTEAGEHRPWLSGGEESALAWLRARDAERRAWYGRTADFVVDVDTPSGDDRPVPEIVAAILEFLAE